MPSEMKKLAFGVPNYSDMAQRAAWSSWLDLYWNFGAAGRQAPILVSTGHTTVQMARQQIVESTLADPDITHLLMVDDDMVFTARDYAILESGLVDNDHDYHCALAFTNCFPTRPCIFGRIPGVQEWGPNPWWTTITEYPKRQIFEIWASGFGMVMVTTRMLWIMREKIGGNLFVCKEMNMPNEDINFCLNAQLCGIKLYCDSRCSIQHIAKEKPLIDESLYELEGASMEYTHGVARIPLLGTDGNLLNYDVCKQAFMPHLSQVGMLNEGNGAAQEVHVDV